MPIIRQILGVKGVICKVLIFHIWTYTSFKQIHEQWYVNGKNCVPNNIDLYLTPLALIVLIMDDASKVNKGLKLCTNSFTYDECLFLINVLHKNFNLKASVQSAGSNNKYIIYIWKQSMPDLFNLISLYIITEMKYKII